MSEENKIEEATEQTQTASKDPSAFSFSEVSDIAKRLNQDSIQSWSESKKDNFIELFKQRAKVARAILLMTINQLNEECTKKHFIGYHYLSNHTKETHEMLNSLYEKRSNDYYDRDVKIGGRAICEISQIAKERAEEIVKRLPNVKKLLEIVAPEIVKLQEELKVLDEEYEIEAEYFKKQSEDIDVENLDESMTLKELKELVQTRADNKLASVQKLDKLQERMVEIDKITTETLKDGIPGVRESIREVVKKIFDQQSALSEVSRRIEEKVKFGDSEAAVKLLEHFEKDEKTIDPEIKQQFDKALEVLKVAPKKLKIKGEKATKKMLVIPTEG